MRILLTGAFNWSNDQIDKLKVLGFEILYVEREDIDIPFDVANIDAVICNWLFVHHDINDFKSLKYIQLLSTGLDRIPLGYIKERNIVLHNAAGVYSIPMAEFAMAGVLQIYKQANYFYANQLNHKWEKKRDLEELFGKRICIIGSGNVGTEVAKRFSAFSDDVYGIDIYPNNNPYMKKVFPVENLKSELAISDIVILTLPLTEQTRNMFSTELFSVIKKGAVFVNIARGGLVDEEALLYALDTKLTGAVIDVFQTEPLSESSILWDKTNLLISPHNSYVSKNNDIRMWQVIEKNIEVYIGGCNEKKNTSA